MEEWQGEKPMGYVARVSMKIKECVSPTQIGYVPCIQANSIRGLQRDVFIFQPGLLRCAIPVTLRVVKCLGLPVVEPEANGQAKDA